MAVYSGNPADRATRNVQPGSLREASRVGVANVSNGTTRNNNFGGLAGSTVDRGFSTAGGGANKMQDRISPSVGMNTPVRGQEQRFPSAPVMKDQARIAPVASMKDQSRITPEFSMPSRPISRTPGPKLSVEAPSYARGIADSITAMGVRGLGYISSVDRANVAAEATAKSVRGLTPRSTPKATGGPTSIVPSGFSKASTGPVPRNAQVMERKPVTTPVRLPVPRPTVQQVRVQSQQKKAAAVTPRVVKDGYVYNRVGNRLQNFGAATSSNNRDANRIRRKQK